MAGEIGELSKNIFLSWKGSDAISKVIRNNELVYLVKHRCVGTFSRAEEYRKSGIHSKENERDWGHTHVPYYIQQQCLSESCDFFTYQFYRKKKFVAELWDENWKQLSWDQLDEFVPHQVFKI